MSATVAVPNVNMLVLPSFDVTRGRKEMVLPEGSSVADMVAAALPNLSEVRQAMVRVVIDHWEVAREHWQRVRPKPGTSVVIRVIPQGGNLRSILSIVITIAAIAAGQFYLGPLLAGANIGLSAATAAALSTAVVAPTASLQFNALQPAKELAP